MSKIHELQPIDYEQYNTHSPSKIDWFSYKEIYKWFFSLDANQIELTISLLFLISYWQTNIYSGTAIDSKRGGNGKLQQNHLKNVSHIAKYIPRTFYSHETPPFEKCHIAEKSHQSGAETKIFKCGRRSLIWSKIVNVQSKLRRDDKSCYIHTNTHRAIQRYHCRRVLVQWDNSKWYI